MAKFLPIEEVLLTACLGSRDLLQQKKMQYLFLAKKVWEDLNFSTLKIANREIFKINKRTNSFTLPCNSVQLSSISYIDCNGVPQPCFRNDKIKKDIVDLSCNYNCSCRNELCNLIKGYEAISEVIEAEMPDNTMKSFTCVTRKSVDKNGFYYEQKQYPQRVLDEGEWVDTVLHSENVELCRLQVTENGCVEECEENYEKVISCGCYSNVVLGCDAEVGDTWIASCGSRADLFSVEAGCSIGRNRNQFTNIYTISECGDRIEFPHNFGYSEVLVRYYSDISLNDMKIPAIAEQCFIMGLKDWETIFDDTRQNLNSVYSRKYSNMKFGLLVELNKYTISEWGTILSPKRHTP